MSEAAHTEHLAVSARGLRHPRGRARRGPDENRRSHLLDAADRIVMRDGPAASMAAIAREAGITKPILYRHFGDKGGLYRALAGRYTDELMTGIRLALVTPGSRRQRTEATIDAYLRVIERNPQVYRFLMDRAAVEDPRVRSQVTLFVRQLAEELAGGIALELSLAPDRHGLATAWSHGIVGMVQGAGDWWLEHPDISREKLVGQLADLIFGAFAAYP